MKDKLAEAILFVADRCKDHKHFGMVKLNKIYTKTGDKGETGLGDGSRVPKHAPRVAAYGTVDEVNAVVGLARLETAGLGGGSST